jgi:hypothetical protein
MARSIVTVTGTCRRAWDEYSPDRSPAIATSVLSQFKKIKKEVTARAELLAEPIEGA